MSVATRPIYGERATPYAPPDDAPAAGPRVARAALVLAVPTLLALLAAATGALSFGSALLVPLAFGGGAMLLGWTRPHLGVLGIVLLCVLDAPMRVFVLDGDPLPWNTFNYLLLAGMAVQAPRLVRLADRQSWLLLALVALLSAELFVGEDLVAGAQHVLSAAAAFGILLAFVRAGASPALHRSLALLAGVIGAVGGLAFYLDGRQFGGINPNAWALSPLTALIAICIGAGGSRERATRVLLVPLAAVNLSWVFLSGSRGTLVVALCCVMYLLFAVARAAGRVVALAVVTSAAVVIALQFPELTSGALHRLGKTFQTEAEDYRQVSLSERTSGRSDLGLGGWYIFTEHPLGVGTGGFPRAWQELRSRAGMSEFGRGERRTAHSGWVLTLAENGLPGVLLLAAWLLSFARDGLRAIGRRRRGLALLACVGIGFHLLFAEFQSKALWLLAAATTAALHYTGPARREGDDAWTVEEEDPA